MFKRHRWAVRPDYGHRHSRPTRYCPRMGAVVMVVGVTAAEVTAVDSMAVDSTVGALVITATAAMATGALDMAASDTVWDWGSA